jgi:hypothetical protein
MNERITRWDGYISIPICEKHQQCRSHTRYRGTSACILDYENYGGLVDLPVVGRVSGAL